VRLTDITIGPEDEMLGISWTNLYSIDPWSAKATVVGPIGYVESNALETGSDGTLYAASGGSFIRVDHNVGPGQTVGSYGPGFVSSGDLAFGPDGSLFATSYLSGTDVLMRVNPVNGAATVVGETGARDVWGLFFFEGALYGLSANGSSCASGGELIRLDTITGAGSHIRCLGFLPAGATNGLTRTSQSS
jgi:hypothetical protein